MLKVKERSARMKMELHYHTNISDCPLSIDEVMNHTFGQGVTHLAITNHDITKSLYVLTVYKNY